MNDAVDRVILERGGMDQGFAASLTLSLVGHLAIVGAGVVASILSREPALKVIDGFAVVVPRGGGGLPEPPAAAAEKAAPQPPDLPEPQPPKAEPPRVQKPPKEEPRRGLPELESNKKRPKRKPEKSPPPLPSSGSKGGTRTAAGPGGAGSSSRTQGVVIFGPEGPGLPYGNDSGGDWYLATVQQKIWIIWTQQIKTAFNEPIGVTFTILADGSVEDLRVVQPSGSTLLNLAAQRAIATAQPFGPLPKSYGTNSYPIQVIFKPTP